MLAAFLRTEDGDFEYGPAFGAVLFVALFLIYAWVIHQALKKKRIKFGFRGKFASSKIFTFEKAKNPGWFWFAFYAYGLMMLFCIWAAYAFCTGFFHKPN